nr:hypothetical protein [Tanacetum cinerariifolium]
MSAIKFAKTHNLVVFLKKRAESKGFVQIVDFLNANPIKYALIVNPTIYTSCIQQFWDSAKVKTVNEDVQIRALVDGKRIIVNGASIRRDLQLQDAEGTELFMNYQFGDMSHHKKSFVTSSLTKKVFANMKRERKGFSRIVTPLFETMMKKQRSKRKQRKETKIPHIEPQTKESVPTPSNDPLPSGETRMQLTKLMNLCTNLQKQVLDLEKAKTSQAEEIVDLKKRVKKLERKKKSRTSGLKRLWKVDSTTRVESSKDKERRMNKEEMFGVDDLDGGEVIMDATTSENVEQDSIVVEKEVSTADPVTTAGEVVTTAEGVEVTTIATTLQISKDGLTLAQTLIEIKVDKPKARGVIVQVPKIVEERSKKTQAKVTEGSSKRAGDELEQESPKRQRLKKEDDSVKLKRCLKIVPEDEDDVTIKATPLSSKSPTIIDYKIYEKRGKATSKSSEHMSTMYYLLVEKMYPFTKNILHQLWNDVRLQVDYELEMAYDLLRLIKRQINKGYIPK